MDGRRLERGRAPRAVDVTRYPPPDDRKTVVWVSMRCPYCNSESTQVRDSYSKGAVRVRIHVCNGCRWAFRSIETVVNPDSTGTAPIR